MAEYIRFDEAALAAIFRSADGPVAKQLTRIAIKVERRAKQLASTPGRGRVYGRRRHRASAPGDGPAVDTGRLRASIAHEVGRTGTTLVARVGTDVEYAKFLELGTSKMAARPFLRPALTQTIGNLP
jgi:HK97 gp10 family phage protein